MGRTRSPVVVVVVTAVVVWLVGHFKGKIELVATAVVMHVSTSYLWASKLGLGVLALIFSLLWALVQISGGVCRLIAAVSAPGSVACVHCSSRLVIGVLLELPLLAVCPILLLRLRLLVVISGRAFATGAIHLARVVARPLRRILLERILSQDCVL